MIGTRRKQVALFYDSLLRMGVYCTVVTKPYLAFARVLARSIHEHDPTAELYVLLADRVDGYFDPRSEPFTLITLDDLSDPEALKRMAFYYTPFEFCCAVRPWLHEYLLYNTSREKWIFLDSDIFVCGPMCKAFDSMEGAAIALSPHITHPSTNTLVEHNEKTLLKNGVFNGGFLGIRRCSESEQFIAWFKERLRWYCRDCIRGEFVDQLWLNLVPSLFNRVSIIRDPGVNLGHWNLYGRELTRDAGGQLRANESPLLCVHFSGWSINDPEEVSKFASEWRGKTPLVLRELGQRYRNLLLESGHDWIKEWPYAYGVFEDGTPISIPMRRLYYDDIRFHGHEGSSPFNRSSEFRTWTRLPWLRSKMRAIRRSAKRIFFL